MLGQYTKWVSTTYVRRVPDKNEDTQIFTPENLGVILGKPKIRVIDYDGVLCNVRPSIGKPLDVMIKDKRGWGLGTSTPVKTISRPMIAFAPTFLEKKVAFTTTSGTEYQITVRAERSLFSF